MNLSLMRDRMYFFDPVSVDINDPFYAPEMCLNSTQYISGTEGFMDTIKSAAKAIWEFIKKALTWCKDKIMWLVHKILPGDKEATEEAVKAIEKREAKIEEKAKGTAANAQTNSGPALDSERKALIDRAYTITNKHGDIPFKDLIHQLVALNDDIIRYNMKVNASAKTEKDKKRVLDVIKKTELNKKQIQLVLRLNIIKAEAMPKDVRDLVEGNTVDVFIELNQMLQFFGDSLRNKESIEAMQKKLESLSIADWGDTSSDKLNLLKGHDAFEKLGYSKFSTSTIKKLLTGDGQKIKDDATSMLEQLRKQIDHISNLCDQREKEFNDGIYKGADGDAEEIKRLVTSCLSTIRKLVGAATKNVASTSSLVARYTQCTRTLAADTIQILNLVFDIIESAEMLFQLETLRDAGATFSDQ